MSMTITSLLILIAGILGVGEIFKEEEVAIVINAIVQIVGILGVWYGRYRHGDITVLGSRK